MTELLDRPLTERSQFQSMERFVLQHGWRANARHLAHIIGCTVDEVRQVRDSGAVRQLPQALSFSELFTLWHGRPPDEADWPTPDQHREGEYEWLAPEIALLASLVGVISIPEIAAVLTARLRAITGDPSAERTLQSVTNRMARIGLVTTDVVGGVTVRQATQDSGASINQVYDAIEAGLLISRRVGRLVVVDRASLAQWKARRRPAPQDWVPLASIRQPLGIRSDKLSEFARMGYVPGALQCNPAGAGVGTQYGTWYIAPDVAARLVEDRRAGRPMPWHGKPLMENLKVTWRLYEKRRHPACCRTCQEIWGPLGAPPDFEEYVRRYPGLAHGAKRHLTMQWNPGLTLKEVAAQAGQPLERVRRAVETGALAAASETGELRVSRTDATRWIARHCPSGDGRGSWISIDRAAVEYGFSMQELHRAIEQGALRSKVGDNGPMRGITYLLRHQVRDKREREGYTHEQAAAMLDVQPQVLQQLIATEGATWRAVTIESGRLPQSTVDALRKRLQSRCGKTVQEAAHELQVDQSWVQARIEDGTVRLVTPKWDRTRPYLTEPMMQRLRLALQGKERFPARGVHEPGWLGATAAAAHAGVSIATLNSWADDGLLECKRSSRGWLFEKASVERKARYYWAHEARSRRNVPAWLQIELA